VWGVGTLEIKEIKAAGTGSLAPNRTSLYHCMFPVLENLFGIEVEHHAALCCLVNRPCTK